MNLLCLGTHLTKLEAAEIVRAFVGAKDVGAGAPNSALPA